MWSLSNSFTSAFKELNPIPHFKATAKLGEFLEALLGYLVVVPLIRARRGGFLLAGTRGDCP
jgi:hypothetical protein